MAAEASSFLSPHAGPNCGHKTVTEDIKDIRWCSNSPVLLDWVSNSWRNWSSNSVNRVLGAGTIPR